MSDAAPDSGPGSGLALGFVPGSTGSRMTGGPNTSVASASSAWPWSVSTGAAVEHRLMSYRPTWFRPATMIHTVPAVGGFVPHEPPIGSTNPAGSSHATPVGGGGPWNQPVRVIATPSATSGPARPVKTLLAGSAAARCMG